MYRLCVATFSSGLWNIVTPLDQILDGRVIQTDVKIGARTASREEIREHVAPAVSKKDSLLATGSDHVYLWPGYHLHHDTAKQGYSDVVK